MKWIFAVVFLIGSMDLIAQNESSVVINRGTSHGHGAVYTHENVYRCGGHFAFGRNSVIRYPLNKTGIPDKRIIDAANLNSARFLPAATAVGNHLYILGGISQIKNQRGLYEGKIWRLSIRNDGSLEEPKETGIIPEPQTAYSFGVVASGNRIYIAGGYSRRTCHYWEIKPDGELGPCIDIEKLPVNIMTWNHMAIMNSVIYAGGPVGHNMKSEKIYYSKIGADGVPRKWRRTTNFPTPVYNGALVADSNTHSLLYFNGDSGKIYQVFLNPDGELGEWKEIAKMPYPELFGFSITKIPGGYLMLGALTKNKPHQSVPATLIRLPELKK